MKKLKKMKRWSISIIIAMAVMLSMGGCAREQEPPMDEAVGGDRIFLTGQGNVAQQDEASPSPSPSEMLPSTAETPESIMLTEPLEEPPEEQVITEHDDVAESDPNTLQIVFLGDSIFDTYRDGTGIPYLVGKDCEANIYNLAIGGTSASIESGESENYEKLQSRSFVGMSLILAGKTSSEAIENTRAWEILQELDVSNTDYFVVEYGMNDFFRAAPLASEDRDYDYETYVGALRAGVSNLKELVPDATIILCGPNYAQFFHDGVMVGDGNVLNNGHGTLFDYKGICQYVAKETQSLFLDAYLDLGINGNTAEQYLEDGVHLSKDGRKVYADYLANMILKYEETKNN